MKRVLGVSVLVSVVAALFVAQGAFADTPSDACFSMSGGTITGYTVGGANSCPLDVDIPATIGGVPVTAIGNNAFNNRHLTGITMPASITSIGNSVFVNNALGSVVIPDSVTTIGNQAFYGAGLTAVTLPTALVSVGDNAFTNNRLTSLVLPNSLTTIGFGAFNHNLLTSITVPGSVTAFGAGAFGFNHLQTVTIGSGITSIPATAFRLNQIASVTVPDTVTSIDRSAFSMQVDGGADATSFGNMFYTRVYTESPSNPNHLQSRVDIEQDLFDVNGNGSTTDFASYGGFVVIPTSVTVNYHDEQGVSLQSSVTAIARSATGYYIKDDPTDYPAPANGAAYTATELEDNDKLLAAEYYEAGDVVALAAPVIDGYHLLRPASPAELTLGAAGNSLTFTYAKNGTGSDELANTGNDFYLIIGAAIVAVGASGALLMRRIIG